jgi:hypothetical protein
MIAKPFLWIVGETVQRLMTPENDVLEGPTAHLAARLRTRPETPVLLLADTTAIATTLTRLPPCPARDRKALIARRLAATYPDVAAKAGLARGKDAALLIALHDCPALARVRAALEGLTNPRLGVALLPYEAAPLLEKWRPTAKKGWHLLLTFDRALYGRQIVTRDGAFVYTRLIAPPLKGTSAAFAAASFACDVQTSRAYLARFGLEPDAPLAVTALLPDVLHKPFAEALPRETDLVLFSPAAAARRLGFSEGAAVVEDDAQSLLALSLRRKLFPSLVFLTAAEKAARRARLFARGLRFGLGAAAAVLIAVLGLNAAALPGLQAQLRAVAAEKAALARDLAALQAQDVKTPLARLQAAAARDRLFVPGRGAPRALLGKLGPALAGQGQMLAFSFACEKDEVLLSLTLRLPAGEAAPREAAERLLVGLRAVLPEAEVRPLAWPVSRADGDRAPGDPALRELALQIRERGAL